MSLIPPQIAPVGLLPGPDIEWEETPCLLCNGRRWSLLLEAADYLPGSSGLRFAVVQCHDCGLCFTNPRPSSASIGQFYPPIYRPHQAKASTKRFRVSALWRRPEREQQVIPWHGRGRLLDFGCGGGAFLERMHRRGWQVTGLDSAPMVVARVRRDRGLHALVGSLPHPQLQRGSFDVITMMHSLEHVHEPLEVLRAAHALLAPGGRLVVAVPNIDSLPFRWFGMAWYALDLPRHLTHFSPQTLPLILQRAGFRPHPLQMVRHAKWMRASAARALELSSPAEADPWHCWLIAQTRGPPGDVVQLPDQSDRLHADHRGQVSRPTQRSSEPRMERTQ